MARCTRTKCELPEDRVRKGARTVVRTTGKVIEKGVEVSEKVAKGAGPVAKSIYTEGKKGARKAKESTLKAAKSLQNW